MSRLFLLFIIFPAFLLHSCTGPDRSSDHEVIAVAAGKQLTLGQAMNEIPAFVLNQDTLSAVYSFANQWVEKQIAVDHARQIGIDQTSDFQEKMNRYQEQLLQNMLKDYVLKEHADEIEVTRQEAQEYYQTHRDQFTFDENYIRFRYLTTQTRTEAENANRDLASGRDWEEIVEEYSVDPEYQLRKSTQFYPISMALADIPPLHDQLKNMGPSERSSIYFFRGQYHFAQLIDIKTEGENPGLDWLIPQITEWLKLEKARRITNAYLRNLYLQAESNNEIQLSNVSEIEDFLTDQ
jgi:hypothetical protein